LTDKNIEAIKKLDSMSGDDVESIIQNINKDFGQEGKKRTS
jgi:hypothetical protein